MPRTKKKKIDSEVAYQEMYNEMRRFRDYELTASTWYTTMLLAILGYLLSLGTQGILDDFWVKLLVSVLCLIIGASGIFSVEYVHRRFDELKKFTAKTYQYEQPNLKDYVRKPYHVIELTLLLLTVFNIGVLFDNVFVVFLLLAVVIVFKDWILDVLFKIKEKPHGDSENNLVP